MSTLQTEFAGQNNSKILPVKIKIGFSPLFSTFFSFFLLAEAYIFQRAEGLDQLMLYMHTLTQFCCYWLLQCPSCGSAVLAGAALVPDGRIQGRWTQKWPSKISCGLGSQRPKKRPNSKFPNCGLILTIIGKNWPKNL